MSVASVILIVERKHGETRRSLHEIEEALRTRPSAPSSPGT